MTAFYHLPGLFEFYEFYRQFLPNVEAFYKAFHPRFPEFQPMLPL